MLLTAFLISVIVNLRKVSLRNVALALCIPLVVLVTSSFHVVSLSFKAGTVLQEAQCTHTHTPPPLPEQDSKPLKRLCVSLPTLDIIEM